MNAFLAALTTIAFWMLALYLGATLTIQLLQHSLPMLP